MSDERQIKVLVIDDSNTIRKSAELFLSKAGFKVVTADDGYDAMGKLYEERPDIIFIDILMPRLDGYKACRIIKDNPEFKNTPIIFLSSKDGVFDKARGKIMGSDEYLTKPFTREGIVEAVKKFVKL